MRDLYSSPSPAATNQMRDLAPLLQLQPIKSGTSPSPAATNQIRDLPFSSCNQPIKSWMPEGIQTLTIVLSAKTSHKIQSKIFTLKTFAIYSSNYFIQHTCLMVPSNWQIKGPCVFMSERGGDVLVKHAWKNKATKMLNKWREWEGQMR